MKMSENRSVFGIVMNKHDNFILSYKCSIFLPSVWNIQKLCIPTILLKINNFLKHTTILNNSRLNKPSLIQEEISKIHNLEFVPHHVRHASNAVLLLRQQSIQLREPNICSI